jgi:cytochrome c oxidase subunit 2
MRIALGAGAAVLLGGCQGAFAPYSTLDPAGPVAREIDFLWSVLFWGALAISASVFALFAYASLVRERRAAPVTLLLWGGGIALPFVTLAILTTLGVRAGAVIEPDPRADAVRIEVIGHRWWWEIVYRDEKGREFYGANEMHIPAGRRVHVHVRSADVIHSFWVPRLAGKMDAIPGVTNVMAIEADMPGAYRGQCAEFCGAQHARMSFDVYAHAPGDYEARLETLAAPARPAPPAFKNTCAHCHSVDPHARAGGPSAPNLANVAQRRRLGAGALHNAPGALSEWITRHHELKPGNAMPVFASIDRARLDEIVAYLEATR